MAATIVGTEGRPLTGTEGVDVVVTNGATQVTALGGDDLICISGGISPFVLVDAGDGDGNDVVDGTGSRFSDPTTTRKAPTSDRT